jgi:predicted nucleotidyltransferase component of viral defense system
LKRLEARLLDDVTDALGLPSSQLTEKDFRVVEILSAIMATALPEGARLIFAGGTCLARAHRLVERMSEDIDLKVTIDPIPASKTALRNALSKVKAAVHSAIVEAGFPEPTVIAKSDNRNISFGIHYREPAETDGPLRPHLLVELTFSPPRLPTIRRNVMSFVHQATKQKAEIPDIECVSLDETAAEKLVSLTRRTAGDLEGTKPDARDPFLVRHIYDLHWLLRHVDRKTVLRLAHEIAASDAEQFSKWFPGYRADPQGWTLQALAFLEQDNACRASYEIFLARMVYGDRTPFAVAFRSISELGINLWKEVEGDS